MHNYIQAILKALKEFLLYVKTQLRGQKLILQAFILRLKYNLLQRHSGFPIHYIPAAFSQGLRK